MRGVGLALGALGAAAGFAFKQFEDSEKLTKQTTAVIKSTGGAAKVSAGHVEELATALMHKTAIDDETIRTGQNLLLTFTKIRNEVGKGNDIFDRATETITDMSVALGQDMKSSAIQVGKALQDPILGMTALRRVGVSFTKDQQEMVAGWVEQGNLLKAQKFILAELTTEFGGSAAAQKTASATMAASLGELAEAAGELLAPAITRLLQRVTQFAMFLQENLQPALAATGAWFRRVWERIGPVVTRFGREFVEAMQQSWQEINQHVLPALRRLWEAAKPLIKAWGVQIAVVLKLALEVLPVLFTALGKAIDHFALVVRGITGIIGVITSAIVWIKDRFVGAWNAIRGPVMAVIGAISFALDRLIGLIQGAVDALQFLASLGTNPNVTAPSLGGSRVLPRQFGGPVSAGQAYVVGERGPELFVPGSGGTVVPNAGSQVINVYLGDEILERVVVRGMTRAATRMGA